MSPYQIGINHPTLSPSFEDDAQIEEAFYLYHYGVEGWDEENPTTIPLNSIEGRLSDFDQRITSVDSQVSASAPYLKKSPGENENIIVPTDPGITPLYISSIFANFQEWQNSSLSPRAIISGDNNGYLALVGYFSIVAPSSSSIAQNIEILDVTHLGIVVKSAASQTANLQEWQNVNGLVKSYVDPYGKVGQSKTIIQRNSSFTLNNNSFKKKLFIINSSSNVVVTIPDDSTFSNSIGTEIDFLRYGSGEVSFLAQGSAAILSESNKNSIAAQYTAAKIIKTDANTWNLYGGIKTL